MAESSWPDPATSRSGPEGQSGQLAARFSADGLYWQPGDLEPGYGDGTGGLVVHVRPNLLGSVRGSGWTSGPSPGTLAIAPNNSGATRTDRVVLRLDRSDWTVRLAVNTGVSTLTRDLGDTGKYEM